MRKFYFVSCLILSMMLCVGLTSCGDDDPVIPDQPEQPDQPSEPENPEEPTSTTILLHTIFYHESAINQGDSISYFALVEDLVKEKQDSVANAQGSLNILHAPGVKIIYFYDQSDNKAAETATLSLVRELIALGEQARGFVYTTTIVYRTYNAAIASDGTMSIIGYAGTQHPFKVFIPRLRGSVWTTSDTSSAINSIAFSANSMDCVINGDESVTFSCAHNGYDLTISQGTEEKCALLLNETGTELRLVRLDGEEVTNGPVFTLAE